MKYRSESSIDRKRFLSLSGMGLLAASVSGIQCNQPSSKEREGTQNSFQINGWKNMLEEALKYRKLDAHNHVNFGDRSPKDIDDSCERLGITKVACSVPRGRTPLEVRESNNTVLKAMKDYPNRILGQCFINPIFEKESLGEIDRCVDNGMVMLGELYDSVKINDPLYFPIIEKCIDYKIPLMLHGVTTLGNWRKGYLPANPINSSLPEDFVDIGRRYPEAMIICGHIGGGGNWEYVCRVLQNAPTIYLDTSGSVSDEGMMDMAIKYLGVERLLFATDINYETGVGKIMWANLSESDRQKVFFDNFNNLLRKRGNHVD